MRRLRKMICDCGSSTGITAKGIATRTKIWKCKHGFGCPMCDKQFEKIEELEHHVKGLNSKYERLCKEAWFLYGASVMEEIIFEIEVYKEQNPTDKK